MAVTEVGIRLSLEGQGQVSTGLNGAADSLNKIDGAAQKVVNSAGKLNDSLNVKGTGLAAVSDSLGKIDKAAVSAATGTTKLKDALGNISHEGDGMASLASKIGMVGASAAAAAAAVGMAVKSLFEASAAGDRLKTMLDFATGNGVKEIDYLRGVTNRLGLEFASTAVAYGQFQAAAKGTALEGQKAKDVFESISKASAVMGLSADQTQGALLALQQMISKGTVQAEELRGQLGERLPGAFQIAAKAMGVTTAELGKMLEQGQVVADDFLPKFAAALNENLGGSAEKAAARLDASVNRFASAWDRLKQAAGDSGISEGVASGLDRFATGLDTLAINMERMNKSKSLSEFFDAAFYSVASTKAEIDSLGKELTQAQAEFEALKKQGNTRGGGFYYEAELGNLAQLIAKLKEAISTKSSLMNTTDPRDQSGYQSRSQGHAAYSAKKAAESKAIADLMADSSGVTAAYIKRAKEIQAANANEGMSVDQLAKAWDSAHSLLKKNTAGVSEAKKAARDYAKELETQADTLAKLSGYNKDYEDQASRLVEMRQKGMFTEEGYLRAVNELVAAQPGMIKLTKDQADAAKEAAKAQEIASKAYDDSLKSVQHFAAAESESLVKAIEAQRLHNEQIGKTPEQIELVKRAVQDRATVELEANAEILQSEITLAIARDSYDNQTLELWNAQLKSLREQITLRKQLAGELNTGAALESVDALGKANKKAAEESSKYWEDALMRAFESGKGFFDSLWDTIKNTLKTQVLKVSLQAIGIGGAAGGAAAADVSNIFSTAENASSMGSMFASAFPTAAATISTVGNAALAGIQSMIGMTGTAAQAATAAANGIAYATTGAASTAASAGSMIAAAGPYVAAAMAIYAIHQATQGETRIGGEYRSNIADGAKYAYGPSGGDSAASQVKLAIDTTTAAINATLKQVGSAATLVGFAAGYETSDRDRGGAYAGGTLSTGVRIGQDGSGDNYAGTKYDPTKGFNQDATGAVKALDLELKQSIIETLQAAGDIPQAVTKVIDDALARANADSVAKLSAEATDSTLAALNTVIGSVEVFNKIVTTLPFKDLADLSFDAAAGLIEFSGGIDNLASNLGGFYQNFYTESEQVALKTEFASKAFADLGQVMPAVDGSMRDWYRSLIDVQLGLDQSDPAIAKVTAGLLGMQGAVNELAPVVNVIKSAITGTTEALKNQAEWQQKLDIATGKTTQREIEKAAALAAADDATDTIINQLYAFEDAAKAADDLKAMDAAIADTSATIRDFYAMLAEKSAQLKQQLQGWADTYAPPDPAVLAARIAESVNTSGATENISAAELLVMTADDLRDWAAKVSQLTVPKPIESGELSADSLRGAIASAVASKYVSNKPAFEAALKDGSIASVLSSTITDALKKLGISAATSASAGASAANTMAAVATSSAADWGAATGIDTVQEMTADWVKDALGNLGPIKLYETVLAPIFGSIKDDVDDLITQITDKENYVAPTAATTGGASAIDTSVTDGLIKEAKSLNIELLKAQGNMSGAATAARDLATGGMDTLQKAMWDANELIRTQIAIQVERNSIKDEYYSVTDTDAQARKRQRDAIDPSNRIMFDLLQAAKDSKAARDTQKSLFGELATDGQKTQLASTQVNDAFKSLDLAVPKTTKAFLDIASGADASTEAGRNIINTLSGVADAFQLVANRNKLIEDLRDEAMQRYIDAQAKVLDAQKAYASALKSSISSMKDFLATLDSGTTSTSVTAARASFTRLADQAAAGDTSVYDKLQPAAKSFLDLSKTYSRSLQEYRRDEATVRNAITGVIKVTEAQLAKLPSELALDTDPIREAWSALQIATNEQTNASVLLTAMSVDQGASRARLAAAEDTLAARYLDAISASPDFSKLKEKFDVAIVDLVNKNAMPDYNEVFKLPEDTLITLVTDQIDQAFPVVTGTEFDFESLFNSQIYNVLPDGMAGTEFDAAQLLQDQITLILPPDFAGTETDLAKLLAAQIGVILPADFAGDMSDLAEMLNTRIGVILPDYFAGTETSLDGILKKQTGIVLFDGMAGDQTSLDGILKTRAEDVLPDRFAGTSFDLAGRVQSRINVFMPTNFAGGAFDLNGLMSARVNDVMPVNFAGQPTNLATLLTTRINSNTLPEDFAGRTPADLAALLESRVENIMPDYFAGRDASDLADMLGERVTDILPVNFAGSAFSAQAMMQTAINNAMNGLFTGTTTTNTGTTGTTPTTNSDYVNGVTQTWKLRTDDPRFYVGTSGVSWGVDYTMADVAQAMQRVSSPAQRDELRMFGRSRGYPGFAEGTSYVPYDMTANIHAGEEITPRPFVDQQRGARDKTNELLEEVIRSNRELKAELAAIKSNTGNTATSSSKTARTIEAVTLGGTEIRTKVIT